MNAFVVRGQEGALCWGYHQAAVLGPWTITGDTLKATVISHDAFRTSQPSVTFRVPRPRTAPWVWPIDTLQIANGTLTARLRPE